MPTMASGMEAEEETEHHLQRAIATETVSHEPTAEPLSSIQSRREAERVGSDIDFKNLMDSHLDYP